MCEETLTRICNKCAKCLPLDDKHFVPDRSRKVLRYSYSCLSCRNEYFRQYRQINATKLKIRDNTPISKVRIHKNQKAYYQRNRTTRLAESNQRSMNARQLAKEQVFDHYGRKCACCGETEQVFLTLDHINGGGTKARTQAKGERFYLEIVRNGFIAELQTLCWNCNWAKHRLGRCPHQDQNV